MSEAEAVVHAPPHHNTGVTTTTTADDDGANNDSRSATPTPSATGTTSLTVSSGWEAGSQSDGGDDGSGGVVHARSSSSQPPTLEELVVATNQDLQGKLRQLHNTVENLPVVQAQAYFVTARCASLVEALMLDGLLMDLATFKAAAENVREVIERVHAKMLQFAVYGRAKATVLIREITGYLEGFNVQIDECVILFAITTHESLGGWEEQWASAQQSDMQVAIETINEVLRDEAKVKAIQILGEQAVHTFNELLDMAEEQGFVDHAERERRMRV